MNNNYKEDLIKDLKENLDYTKKKSSLDNDSIEKQKRKIPVKFQANI